MDVPKCASISRIQVSFNKGFSYPGYTTADVLADIKGNVTKPLVTLTGVEESTLAISDSIAGADVITISAGANDVLKFFNQNLGFHTCELHKS